MPVDCTAILISSTLNISMAVQLPPSAMGLQVNELVATCDLGVEFRSTFNADACLGTDPNSTFLYYNSSIATGGPERILLVDSSNVTYFSEGIMASQVVSGSNSLAIAGFKLLDLDDGLMVISFTKPVNLMTFNFTDLSLQNSPVNEATSINVSLTNGSCEGACDIGQQITFHIILADLDQIKLENRVCVSISTCYPHHTEALVTDLGSKLIAPYRFGLNYLLQRLILDTTQPILVSCNLDLSIDNLRLVFDEPVDVGTFNPSNIDLNAYQNSSAEIVGITLTNASSIGSPSSSIIVIDLGLDSGTFKASTLEMLQNGVYVLLLSSAFEDMAGNRIQSGSVVCDFIPDSNSPKVLSFDLDLDSNLLHIRFSEPIQLESLNISGFRLISSLNATINMDAISLNDTSVYMVDFDSLPSNETIMMVSIAFGSQSLTRIKTSNDIGTTISNTFLLIDDNSFVDTNGNSYISAEPIPAGVVTVDNSPATAISFTLDMNIGQIDLTFNDVVDVSTWYNGDTFLQRAAFTHNSRFQLSGTVISGDSNIILLRIYNLNSLKQQLFYGTAIDLNSTYLTIRAHAINDIRGIDIIAVTDGNGVNANTYVPDIESPQFIYFNLDMNSGALYFYFDEPVKYNPSLFTLQGDSMAINVSSSINISFSSSIRYCHQSCYYYLPSSIFRLIRRDPNVARNANTTNLVIMQGGVNDTSGNPIIMGGLFNVRYYYPASSKYLQINYINSGICL